MSLLPAVLFDLCLADRQRSLAAAGYGLSVVAIVLHVAELFQENERLPSLGPDADHRRIRRAHLRRRDQGSLRRATTSRLVGTMSLFLLAMSFVHLWKGDAHQVWSRELAFHHAAIPLALLVLLQDYRFVLLDAFLRFLANVLLAALFVSGVAAAWRLDLLPQRVRAVRPGAAAGRSVPAADRVRDAARTSPIPAHAAGVSPARHGRAAAKSQDTGSLEEEPVSEYLAAAAAQLGEFMGARATVAEDSGLQDLELRRPALVSEFSEASRRTGVSRRRSRGSACIWLPAAPIIVLLGRRTGGRRYLSEDLQALGRAASAVVEQIEQFRESEMRRLVAQAELRALQSQIHPHFLFNALNALYGIIPREAKGARETVLNLADIFRYFLETRKIVPAARRGAAHRQGVSGSGAPAAGRKAPHRNQRGPGSACVCRFRFSRFSRWWKTR